MVNMLHRKDSIIFTTIDVINESGIQSVSTREVAKRAGISEATIFKHFKTKADLILAVLDHYSQYDSDIFVSTINRSEIFRERILYFFNSFIEYYNNYPQITSVILSYDVLSADPNFRDKVHTIFKNRCGFVEKLISEGQENGEVRKDIDPIKLTTIFIGSLRDICLRWRQDNFNFSLEDFCKDTLNILLDAFCI